MVSEMRELVVSKTKESAVNERRKLAISEIKFVCADQRDTILAFTLPSKSNTH